MTPITDDQASALFADDTTFDPANPDVIVHERDQLAALADARARRDAAAADIEAAVAGARGEGATWQAIAAVLGVSHQAVMQRYRKAV